jgi:MSHA biogenesis protein MshL
VTRAPTAPLRTACALALCLALACASAPRVAGPAEPAARAEPEPLPAAPPNALQPRTLSLPEDSPRPPAMRLLESTRFSLFVQDAELRGVLLGLVKESPLNVVVDEDVRGVVSADLKNVSLLEVLDQVVAGRGYRYALEGDLLRIFREDRETRTYQVDYPSYTRKGDTRVSLAGFAGQSSNMGGGSSGSSSSGAGSGSAGGAQDTSVSEIETQQQIDLWAEIEAAIRTLVFGAPDATREDEDGAPASSALAARRVIVSRQSGLVTVTAESAVLEEVERYLADVASSTQRQVLIDAQIIEVRLDDDFDLGVDFEAAGDDGVFERLIVPGLKNANVAQALAPVLNEGGISIGIAKDSFGAILRAIAKQTDVRVLSTPRVSTLNNHKAMIKAVRNQVFFVAETETVLNQNIAQTTTEFVPNVIPVGVNLDVTPQVSADGEITLHVRPSVSEIASIELQPRASATQPQNGSLPVVDIRETDSVLRVRDGETIVLGGLVQTRELELERKVPGLGDLPLLGNAFRSTHTEEIRTELLIFLTPTVLDAPRIARVSADLRSELEAVDALRAQRTQRNPWWRVPRGRSYGAF